MIPNLPEDLVEEILFRVPAKSLMRLRSICKKWNKLFIDKQFTKKHFSNAAKQFMVVMMKDYRFYSISVNLYEIHNDVDDPSFVVLNPIDSRGNSYVDETYFHCDGLLLCFSNSDTEIMVWNPCTQKTKKIIKPRQEDVYGLNTVYAFGYEKNTSCHIYKILHFPGSNYPPPSKTRSPETIKLGIYDFDSDSWRIFYGPCHHMCLHCRDVSLKGNTYWIAKDTIYVNNILLSFNFTTERFGSWNNLPFECSDLDIITLSSFREEEHLAFMHYFNIFEIRVWVTNKIEPSIVSWIKFFTVSMTIELIFRGGFSDMVSFFIDEERKVVVCHDRNDLTNTRMVYIIGENEYREEDLGVSKQYWSYMESYVPSLVQF